MFSKEELIEIKELLEQLEDTLYIENSQYPSLAHMNQKSIDKILSLKDKIIELI